MTRHGYDIARPGEPDPAMPTAPMLGLDAGYVRRGAHLIPKQGTGVWRVPTRFREDERRFRRDPVDDGVLHFSRVQPAGR